ncbi:hypothetical protein SELMODRAFT_127783, partial [Selaginella moellendorffii]
RDVCRALVSGWSDLGDDDLAISEISGGITNLLLKVLDKKQNEAVTVRIFGPNTDAVIDRKRELQVLPHLSESDFGAKLVGLFENGMIQSFIEARTLVPVDLSKPNVASLIAKELRRLHSLQIPGSKEPQLWEDILKFYDKGMLVSFEDNAKQERLGEVSFSRLMDDIKMLKGISDSLKAPIVFSHNDLLSGNIMLNEASGTYISSHFGSLSNSVLSGRLHLIDFEYGSYSYRGYDIGNHFNEYAGFECDYSLYPNKEAQYHFFRHYLSPIDPSKVSDDELEVLFVETNFYALVSHLYWAIWAIVQAKFSPINFDYLGYHCLRYKEYERRKKELAVFSIVNICKQ